jgi:hypothetical protein
MSKADLEKIVEEFQKLIDATAKEKLTLAEWQNIYRSVIVLFGLRITQDFRGIAITSHQQPGPHLEEKALDLAAFTLSLYKGRGK